jgi:cation diffusion facilitator CzcD-associated flavoprotein CzcO
MFHNAGTDYDLAGKRVAVIGTGASSVRVVPSIAPVVSKLILQRTPAWVVEATGHRQARSDCSAAILGSCALASLLIRDQRGDGSDGLPRLAALVANRRTHVRASPAPQHRRTVSRELRPPPVRLQAVLISDNYWPGVRAQKRRLG